jgi:HlyD family secretion protein
MKKKRLWIWGVAVVIVLVVVAKVMGPRQTLTEVTTEQVVPRDLIQRVAASGKIQPEVEVNITAEVSGQILNLPVKEGDYVRSGDLLCIINPDVYEAALNRATAALNTTRSNLASARAQKVQADAQFEAAEKAWIRTQQLFEDAVISQAEYDTGEANFQTSNASRLAAEQNVVSAEYSISSAEASVQEARDNLSRTTLRAPQSGTVTALSKEVGESVQGTGFMAGEVIMKVSDLQAMEVNLEVNESDIVRVTLGDQAEIEVDAYLKDVFQGEVSEIGNTALNALATGFSMDQVTNFSVKVRLLESSYAHLFEGRDSTYSPFRPGMSATVDLLTARASQALSIPIQAVTTRQDEEEDESEIGVFIVRGDSAIWTPIETGIQDSRNIEVTSGLSENDEVITGPYEWVSRKLEDGELIAIKAKN